MQEKESRLFGADRKIRPLWALPSDVKQWFQGTDFVSALTPMKESYILKEWKYTSLRSSVSLM